MCRQAIYLFFVFFLFSCRRDPSLWQISNLSGNKIRVFGHGGMGINSRLPLNSLASFNEAVVTGADGIEMDMQLSADYHLYIFHDEKLEHSTTCTGELPEQQHSQLQQCNYKKGNKKHALVSAHVFFELIDHRRPLLFTFDCKLRSTESTARLRRFAQAIANLVKTYEVGDRCSVESNNTDFLMMVKEEAPAIDTYFYCTSFSQALEELKTGSFNGLTIDMNKISATEIREAHSRNLKIALFNARTSQQNITAIQMSPDHIQTDKLRYLVDVYVKTRD